MTKMSTPKMDVIRFNESDVIAASGVVGKTLSITGIGDGQSGNAFLNIGGTSYSSSQVVNSDSQFVTGYNAYMSGIDTYDSAKMIWRGNNDSLTINTALSDTADRSSNNSYSWIDGTYVWSNDDRVWYWQHQ